MKCFPIGGKTPEDDLGATSGSSELSSACVELGRSVASDAVEILVCSPFDDAADSFVLRGVAAHEERRNVGIRVHYIDSPQVRTKLDGLLSELKLTKVARIPNAPPRDESIEARRFAWLLCQIKALEEADVVFAIGGGLAGAANMLLLLAEAWRKPVLPFPYYGGAAKESFDRRRYDLVDRLGSKIEKLHEKNAVSDALGFASDLVTPRSKGKDNPKQALRFFISYPRARQAEADHVETMLRRRNLYVYRDEVDLGPGHSIPEEIRRAIYNCDVFIAIWCVEYACSPWCHDELELAMDRLAEAGLKLWLLRVDETRIVPQRARNLLLFDVRSRMELEGKVLDLIGRE